MQLSDNHEFSKTNLFTNSEFLKELHEPEMIPRTQSLVSEARYVFRFVQAHLMKIPSKFFLDSLKEKFLEEIIIPKLRKKFGLYEPERIRTPDLPVRSRASYPG